MGAHHGTAQHTAHGHGHEQGKEDGRTSNCLSGKCRGGKYTQQPPYSRPTFQEGFHSRSGSTHGRALKRRSCSAGPLLLLPDAGALCLCDGSLTCSLNTTIGLIACFLYCGPAFCISLPAADSPEAPFRGCLQVHPRTALASEGKTIDACRKGVRPDEWPLNAKVIRSEVSIPSRGFTVFGSCRAPQLVPLQTLRLDPQPGPGLRVVLISCIGGWRDCSTSRVGRPGFRGARHPCLEMTSRSIKHRRCLTNLVRKTPHGGQS